MEIGESSTSLLSLKTVSAVLAGAALAAFASANAAASGYSVDIEKKTLENDNYREVLFTGPLIQLVVMKLEPGEEIGLETHDAGDQFIRVEAGNGEAVLDDERIALTDGSVVVIPAGVAHNVVNTSDKDALRLYVIYSPPEHPDGTVHRSRSDDKGD